MPSKPLLVMADWEPPGTFDPTPPTTAARLRADAMVFARLWTSGPEGRLLPDLAASVPQPAGGSLTVRLRPGLVWSDGSPLTAGDVVRSCARFGIRATALSATAASIGTGDAASLVPVFIAPALPDGRLASGPFRLAAADRSSLRFERNPHYHGRRPLLASIVELLSASHDAMIEAAQATEVDYLPHLGPADVGAHLGPLRTVVTVSEREEVLVPSGLDAKTVAALAAATDRQALVDQVFGHAGAALGLPAQPALAAHLLAGAAFPLRLVTVCDDPLRAAEAAALAAMWAAVGFSTTLTCAPVAQLTAGGGAPHVALYSVLRDDAPAGAVPLLLRPAIRAVSPRLHGFVPNDTAGTDLWNVADWWLD